MNSSRLFPALLIASLFPILSAAAQEPMARGSIPDESGAWVGQRITVIVELLAPGIFAGAPSYELPDPKGALLLPPSGRPVLSSEKINGTDYTVQRHELFVFARRAGTLTIPPCKVRFAYKRSPLDREPLSATVATPSLTFTAKIPPGAEKLGSIISGRGLTAVEKWQPEPGKAKAGDAFTRTVTFAASDIPAMAFPLFPVPQVDGLGFYPKAPEVLDHAERGEFRGERRDTVTCVCRRAGTFVIPPVSLTWFDLDTTQLKTINFPARTLEVAPNPAMPETKPAEPAAERREPGMLDLLLQAILPACLMAALVRWKGRTVAAFLSDMFRAVHLLPLNPAPPPSAGHPPEKYCTKVPYGPAPSVNGAPGPSG
jgi:hypothetical protein